jgi:hypothetical protein
MKKLTILYVLCQVWVCANAQIAPKYSNDFLNIGAGARAAAMGNAVVASVSDVTSGYWNPANLMQIKDNIQLSLMHNEQFAGIVKNDYGALSFKLNNESVLAVSAIRVGVDDIPNTLSLFENGQIDYSRISSFSAIDYGFIVSYARSIPKVEGLHVGGNAKVIRRIVGDFANAWGFGIDVAASYTRNKWTFGLMARDITTTFNAWSYTFTNEQKNVLLATNNKLPQNALELTLPRFIVGAKRSFHFFSDHFSVLPEINADITTDGRRNVVVSSRYLNIDVRMGLELGYKNIFFIRGGLNNFQRAKTINGERTYTIEPSVGAGLKINAFSVDYALSNVASASGLPFSNIISVKLGINRKN